MARLLNVILILGLNAYLVSSRGIVDRTMPTNISCHLDIEGAKALKAIQREGSVYIKMDLKFVDTSGIEIDKILKVTDKIVNIKRWVLAIGPRGVQLLKYPHNAVRLSLGTLKSGVERVSLNVLSVDCFLNADDDEKLDIIATSLANFQSTEGLTLDQAICLENLLTPPFMVFIGKWYFDCWRLVTANEYYTDKSHTGVFILGIIVLLYLSLFLLSFFCRNPPLIIKNEQNKMIEYISVCTDLNIGVKYVLFFAGNECCCSILFILRCLVYLGLWQYLPLMMNYILVDKEYRPNDYLIVSIIINAITLVSTTVILYKYKHFIKNNPDYNLTVDNRIFKLLNLPLDKIYDPTAHLIGFHKTVNIINQIMVALVTLKFWESVWEETKQKYNRKLFAVVFVCKSIIIIIMTIPLILVCLNLACLLQDRFGCSLAFCLYVLISYAWLIGYSLYPVVLNLLEILYYFFIGLLTNSTYIFNVVFVSFFIIVYYFTILTDFNASYVKFLRQVMDSMDKVVGKNTAAPEQAHVSNNISGQHSELYIKRNGLTYIEKECFDEMVKKYRPLGPKIVIMLVKLVISGYVIYIAAKELESTDQLHSLSAEVRSIPVIFIPLVIPFFYKLTKNEAQEENEIEVLKARIEEDIKERLKARTEEDSEQRLEEAPIEEDSEQSLDPDENTTLL